MDNHTVISTEEPGSSEEVRNWLELPYDVLSHIFLKLGVIGILFTAQSVCSTWRKVSKEPSLFRIIDTRNRWGFFDDAMYCIEKIAREAVDRSCGQLVEFSMEFYGPGSDELLAYVADKSSELRCLRLVWQANDDALINMAKKAVMLEELEICDCSFSEDTLVTVASLCPQLKLFRLNSRGYRLPHIKCDNVALAIAESMSELRHLNLFGNKLTNVGLKAILDVCLHLESLDLRQCFNVYLEGYESIELYLLKCLRDRRIKLRHPDDSIDDYEFEASVGDGSFGVPESSCDSDYEYDIDYHPDFAFDYHPDFAFDYHPDLDSDDSEFGYDPDRESRRYNEEHPYGPDDY